MKCEKQDGQWYRRLEKTAPVDEGDQFYYAGSWRDSKNWETASRHQEPAFDYRRPVPPPTVEELVDDMRNEHGGYTNPFDPSTGSHILSQAEAWAREMLGEPAEPERVEEQTMTVHFETRRDVLDANRIARLNEMAVRLGWKHAELAESYLEGEITGLRKQVEQLAAAQAEITALKDSLEAQTIIAKHLNKEAIEHKAARLMLEEDLVALAEGKSVQTKLGVAALSNFTALKERAERAEDFALAHEKWEANLVLNGNWNTDDGLPQMTQDVYDEAMQLQKFRNQVLGNTLTPKPQPAVE